MLHRIFYLVLETNENQSIHRLSKGLCLMKHENLY